MTTIILKWKFQKTTQILCEIGIESVNSWDDLTGLEFYKCEFRVEKKYFKKNSQLIIVNFHWNDIMSISLVLPATTCGQKNIFVRKQYVRFKFWWQSLYYLIIQVVYTKNFNIKTFCISNKYILKIVEIYKPWVLKRCL